MKQTRQKPSDVIQSFLDSLDGIKKDYKEKYRIDIDETYQKSIKITEKIIASTKTEDYLTVLDELTELRKHNKSIKDIISKLVTASDFMQYLYNELKTLEESIEKEGNDEAS